MELNEKRMIKAKREAREARKFVALIVVFIGLFFCWAFSYIGMLAR